MLTNGKVSGAARKTILIGQMALTGADGSAYVVLSPIVKRWVKYSVLAFVKIVVLLRTNLLVLLSELAQPILPEHYILARIDCGN